MSSRFPKSEFFHSGFKPKKVSIAGCDEFDSCTLPPTYAQVGTPTNNVDALLTYSQARSTIALHPTEENCLGTKFCSLRRQEIVVSYDLVFADPPVDPGTVEKDMGENILFSDLPTDYKVYALYFPAEPPDSSLEDALRSFGHKTGKNLMMYFGSVSDPKLEQIMRRFDINRTPVIIVTAVAELASPHDDYSTTYARIDSKKLLSSPQRTLECVEKVFSLFLQGEVAKAISSAKWKQRAELASAISSTVGRALKAIGDYITTHDIVISLAIGKLELKRSGGK